MNPVLDIVFTSYFIGSIPFGLILTWLAGVGDLRKIGSGNIGTTNVLRTGNKGLALLTLLLDGGKGALAAAYAFILYNTNTAEIPVEIMALTAGFFAIAGHCFPVWLKFKGGKGFATTLGVFLAAVPVAGILAIIAWISTFLLTRISSLSAFMALATAVLVTFIFYNLYATLGVLLIAAFVVGRHKENINRLRKGEESRFEFGKKK